MKPCTFKMKFSFFIYVLVIIHSVNCSTLAPPLSPVKVLAASGISDPADKLRYYSFSDEDEKHRDMDSAGSSNPYASKDPFEVPSLSSIAELMRRRDKYVDRDEFSERDRPEHRSGGGKDTGWGWRQSRPDEDRDRDRGGWDSSNSRPRPPPPPPTTPPSEGGWGWSDRKPPSRPSQHGWEDRDGPRPSYGKGSYTPVDNKDAYRPWQIDTGVGHSGGGGGRDGWIQVHTTTERPRYTPNYLASDEDKYRPIRYPPSVTGGGSASGSSRGGGWPDSGGGRPSSPSSVWPNRPQDSSSWNGDRGKSPEPVSGPGPLYLPPHRDHPPPLREPPPPPLRDPPRWPTNDHDREPDRDRDGWRSPPSQWQGNNRPPLPPPPHNNAWNFEPSRPRPPASWPSRDEPAESKGWGRPPPPPPPPTTPGWGWDRDSNREDPPRRPGPFEYKPGVDDLLKNIGPPVDIYEKPYLPPGISRDRPYSQFETSEEDFPKAPNHYRIVAETPSPEEIHKILYQKPVPGVKEAEYPPNFSSSSHHRNRPGSGQDSHGNEKCSGGNRNCHSGDDEEQDKEKWFKENFQKDKISDPEPTKSDSKLSSSSSSPPHPNDSKVDAPLGEADGKRPISKRTRYDAQGFKYIPYDDPVARKIGTQPRDIYSNLNQRDTRNSRDSFKRAVQDKIKEREKARETTRLQGSESRNTFVRKTVASRSHISLWKSDDHSTSPVVVEDNNKAKIIASTTTTTTTTRPSRITNPIIRRKVNEPEKEKVKEERVEDFGRKIQIIRNRLKKPEGGFKPNSGPFGARMNPKLLRNREALMEASDDNEDIEIDVIKHQSSTTVSPAKSSTSSSTTTMKTPATTQSPTKIEKIP